MQAMMQGTMHLNRLTQPATELLSLATAKQHLRIDTGFTDEDGYISTLITVAREWAEDFTKRSIGSCNWELVIDQFPANRNYIELPMAPLTAVTSIVYYNAGGVQATFDPTGYLVDVDRSPGAVYLPYYGIWPVLVPQPGAAVRIAFTAGHTSANIPARILQAMLLLVGHWYMYREEVTDARKIEQIPVGVESLLWPLRIHTNGDFNGNMPLDSYVGGSYYGAR